ncbi:MAG: cell division protein SepF [Veillonellaceae bacterium]|jgi:cell division inhibitor SepF|nr:cell division protein SepF [Veillonellaceae bacterium]
MAVSLIDKLTNFIMPADDFTDTEEKQSSGRNKPSRLRVHSNNRPDMKMAVLSPLKYEDVKDYADYLKAGISIVVNFSQVDDYNQQCMTDFLSGVCYTIGGSSERVSSKVLVYVPANASISKELYAYSIPTYVKGKFEVK